jgi:hypothetical protein
VRDSGSNQIVSKEVGFWGAFTLFAEGRATIFGIFFGPILRSLCCCEFSSRSSSVKQAASSFYELKVHRGAANLLTKPQSELHNFVTAASCAAFSELGKLQRQAADLSYGHE